MVGVHRMVDLNTKNLIGFNIFNFPIITIIIFITILTIFELYGFLFEVHTYETKDSDIVYLCFYFLVMTITIS